ncbi:MAG: S-methyl-5-thioribose-1-phosphate isomerase, partial [Thaumarchaeota archaeon]|nr:S-methyl-5-thioribose-1-phosphate isomerase [Nitrososphaerota archaeon]
MKSEIRTVYWKKGEVVLIDQRLLPLRVKYLRLRTAKQVAKAIKEMAVRGAPAIGVAAAMGLALTAYHCRSKDRNRVLERLRKSYEVLRATRPTAVNLFWALN